MQSTSFNEVLYLDLLRVVASCLEVGRPNCEWSTHMSMFCGCNVEFDCIHTGPLKPTTILLLAAHHGRFVVIVDSRRSAYLFTIPRNPIYT